MTLSSLTPTTPPLPEAAPQSWAVAFEPFTAFHAVTVTVFTAIILAACFAAVRKSQKHELRIRRGWVGITVITQITAVVWYLLPANFDPLVSWPLHVCDLAAWFVPFALLTTDYRIRAMLYFWGIGLSSQAFFTPVLSEGYADAHFWFFWLGHTQIIGAAVYDVWVRGYRPTLVHFRFAMIAGLVYALAMVGFNEALGSNYCYVGRTLPDKYTILHELPPWPWRVVVLMLLGVFIQFLAVVPFLVLARIAKSSGVELCDAESDA